jgi:hypothetical protein
VTLGSTMKGEGRSPDMVVSSTRFGTSTGRVWCQGWERESCFWDDSQRATVYIYRDRALSRPYLNHGAGPRLMLGCNE